MLIQPLVKRLSFFAEAWSMKAASGESRETMGGLFPTRL